MPGYGEHPHTQETPACAVNMSTLAELLERLGGEDQRQTDPLRGGHYLLSLFLQTGAWLPCLPGLVKADSVGRAGQAGPVARSSTLFMFPLTTRAPLTLP